MDAGKAGEALGLSEAAVSAAAKKLRAVGLLGAAPRAVAPADELPPYRAEEIVLRSREDPVFQALVAEAQAVGIRKVAEAIGGPDSVFGAVF